MENIEILENSYLVIENGRVLDYGIGKAPQKYIDKNLKLLM